MVTGKFLAVAVDGFGNDVVSCLAELFYPGCKTEARELVQCFHSGECVALQQMVQDEVSLGSSCGGRTEWDFGSMNPPTFAMAERSLTSEVEFIFLS